VPREIGQDEDYGALPVQSSVCSHMLCFSCVQKPTRTAFRQPDGDLENNDDGYPCPICWKENAFHAKRPIISTSTCKILREIQYLSSAFGLPQGGHDDTRETNLSVKPSSLHTGTDTTIQESQDVDAENPKESKVAHPKQTFDIYSINEEPQLPRQLEDKLSIEAMSSEEESVSNAEAVIKTDNESQVSYQPPVQSFILAEAVWLDRSFLSSALEATNVDGHNQDVPEPYLAAGTIVDDPPVAHAEPWVPIYVKYRHWLYGVLLVAIIVAAAILAVEIPKVNRTKAFTMIVLQVSSQSSEKGLGQPQKLAMKWLLDSNNTKFDPKKDRDQIEQRYQLATFCFSTGGQIWYQKGKFLSSDDECTWFQDSVKCSSEQKVINITVGEHRSCIFKLFATNYFNFLL